MFKIGKCTMHVEVSNNIILNYGVYQVLSRKIIMKIQFVSPSIEGITYEAT